MWHMMHIISAPHVAHNANWLDFPYLQKKSGAIEKKMKRDTIDICTVIFVQWRRQHMLQRRGLEGRNHFGIRPKKVKAVFKMTADLKFGITEHLHKEFYNGGQKSDWEAC